MKKIIPALLLLGALAVWFIFGKSEKPAVVHTGISATEKNFPTTTNPASALNDISSSLGADTSNPASGAIPTPTAEQPSSAATVAAPAPEPLPPLTILDNCRLLIASYRSRFGENPVGNNAEITAALAGENPKSVNFLRSDDGLRINAQGELIDAYGTPFFFHQLSAKQMEIRSAGQDRKLFTFDDQIVR